MSNFHGRLMNIPQPIGVRGDYYEGHRDARHAAAEIGIEADTIAARLAVVQLDLTVTEQQNERFAKLLAEATIAKEQADEACQKMHESWGPLKARLAEAVELLRMVSYSYPEHSDCHCGVIDDVNKFLGPLNPRAADSAEVCPTCGETETDPCAVANRVCGACGSTLTVTANPTTPVQP